MSNIGLDGRGVSPPINGGEYGLISDLYKVPTTCTPCIRYVCTYIRTLFSHCMCSSVVRIL